MGKCIRASTEKRNKRSVLKQIQESVIYSTWVAFIVQYCRPRLSRNPWWNRGGLISKQHDTMCAPGSSPRSSWLVPNIEGAKDHCPLILQARIMECIWWSMPCHAIGGVWHWKVNTKIKLNMNLIWLSTQRSSIKAWVKDFTKLYRINSFLGEYILMRKRYKWRVIDTQDLRKHVGARIQTNALLSEN